MATIMEKGLEGYRVETFLDTYENGRQYPAVRIVRKTDGAFIPLLQEIAFSILWNRANGMAEAENIKWVKATIADFEKEAAASAWEEEERAKAGLPPLPFWLPAESPTTAVAAMRSTK